MAISVVRKRRGAGPFPAGTQGQRLHYLHYGFALDSFSVSPLEYPLKPVDEWRLAAALDWARQQKRPVLRVGGRAISSGRDHLSEYLGP